MDRKDGERSGRKVENTLRGRNGLRKKTKFFRSEVAGTMEAIAEGISPIPVEVDVKSLFIECGEPGGASLSGIDQELTGCSVNRWRACFRELVYKCRVAHKRPGKSCGQPVWIAPEAA